MLPCQSTERFGPHDGQVQQLTSAVIVNPEVYTLRAAVGEGEFMARAIITVDGKEVGRALRPFAITKQP